MKLTDLKTSNLGIRLLLFFIFFCPIFYYNGINLGNHTLRIGQEQFFQLSATILFACLILENIYLSAFLLLSIFLYCYYGFPNIGGAYVTNILFGCIIYQVSYNCINKKNIKMVYIALIGLCIVNAIYMILQRLGYDFIYCDIGKSYQGDHVGMFGLKAFMGMFFAMCIPFIARFSLWLSLPAFIPAYFSNCTVAIIGGGVAFLWSAWNKCRLTFWLSLIAIVIGSGVYAYQDSKMGMMEDRVKLWRIVAQDAFKKPYLGWGLDSFRHIEDSDNLSFDKKNFLYFRNQRTKDSGKFVYHEQTKSLVPPKDFYIPGDTLDPWDNPHNEYLQLIYEFGILGLIICFFFFKDIFRRYKESDYDEDLVAMTGFFMTILIFSIGQFPFHVARIGFLIPVIFGAYYKLTDKT